METTEKYKKADHTFRFDLDGYEFAEKVLEGVTFKVRVDRLDGEYVIMDVKVDPEHEEYFNTLNTKYWYEEAKKFLLDDEDALIEIITFAVGSESMHAAFLPPLEDDDKSPIVTIPMHSFGDVLGPTKFPPPNLLNSTKLAKLLHEELEKDNWGMIDIELFEVIADEDDDGEGETDALALRQILNRVAQRINDA